MTRKSYDWVKLKLEFIKSTLSTRDFAEAYGIPYSTFSKRVMTEKWIEERKQIGSKTEAKSIVKTVEKQSDLLSEFEDKTLKAVNRAHQKLLEQLELCERASDIKSVSGALKDLQQVYRLALGASTENQATQEVRHFGDWLEDLENGRE